MKKGVFSVLTLVAGSLLLFSCNRVSDIVTQEQKEDASAQIKLANEKFLSILSEKFDSSEVDFDDVSTDTLTLNETVSPIFSGVLPLVPTVIELITGGFKSTFWK